MPSFPRSFHRVWLAAAVLAVALSAISVAGGAPDANAAGAMAHWSQEDLIVRDETGYPEYRRALTSAIERWNASGANVTLRLAAGRGAGCDDPRPAEIPVCRHTFSGSRAGEAWAWASGDHIVRAKVLLDTRRRSAAQLLAVTCHELGHALGLAHREETSSCMTAVVHATSPDRHDHTHVRAAHAHVPHPAAGTDPGGDASCGLPLISGRDSKCNIRLLPRTGHGGNHQANATPR